MFARRVFTRSPAVPSAARVRCVLATLPVALLMAALVCGPLAARAHGEAAHGAKAAAPARVQKAWGIAGQAKTVNRTVEVGMADNMRFTPAHIEVQQGQTLRFVIRNTGALRHEFVLGTRDEHERHAAMMAKMPDMQHDEPYMAHVDPGKTGQIVWTFNRAGDFDFACLMAGHYQAGMVGSIKVRAAARGAARATGTKAVPHKAARLTKVKRPLQALGYGGAVVASGPSA